MQGDELLRLVDAIHRDRNVDKEVLFGALEHALLTAVRKKLGETARASVTINRETGEQRIVGPTGEIEMADLGRIAAQNAKQVLGQIIREAEREVIFSEYDRFQRALVTGTVYRLDGTAVVVNLGKTEGYLPKHEQVRGESYRVGDRILCYVVEVKKIGNRVKIILSRSHPDMIRRLFEREIPEIADGVVDIVQLVREAGYKTKVACTSLDAKVDPIGACVGVRGTRIRNIIDELSGEKIDIIRHSDSPEVLIVNALKPAQINSITLYEDMRKALVVVDEDQLSLAIGKKGANVRLASKLSGWDIDILSEAEARDRGLFDTDAPTDQAAAGSDGAVVPSEAPAEAAPAVAAVAETPAVEETPAVDEAPVEAADAAGTGDTSEIPPEAPTIEEMAVVDDGEADDSEADDRPTELETTEITVDPADLVPDSEKETVEQRLPDQADLEAATAANAADDETDGSATADDDGEEPTLPKEGGAAS